MNGSSESEGRVEICYNNTYGTVCDDSWDELDAQVVCRQLGFNFSGKTFMHACIAASWSLLCCADVAVRRQSFFGAGSGPIFVDDVQCAGDEDLLRNCTADFVVNDCDHTEDAGVVCGGEKVPVI